MKTKIALAFCAMALPLGYYGYCLLGLSLSEPSEAARSAIKNNDLRFYEYWTNSEGAYATIPGIDPRGSPPDEPRIELKGIRGWSTRTLFGCMDYDDPISAIGQKRINWAQKYNAEICRIASKKRLKECKVDNERLGGL